MNTSYDKLNLSFPWQLKLEVVKQMTFEECLKYDKIEAKKSMILKYMIGNYM